jgi:translation elongation factor EF-Tu-like GTPase
VTGRVTRGKLKVGVDVDLVGYDRFFKAKVNGELDRWIWRTSVSAETD